MTDNKNTWKGYPMGKGKCHCGAHTYITGRGTPRGWTGIECCGCGNLVENCACGGTFLLPSKERVKQIVQDQKCLGCPVYEKREVEILEDNIRRIEKRMICTVTGLCEKKR